MATKCTITELQQLKRSFDQKLTAEIREVLVNQQHQAERLAALSQINPLSGMAQEAARISREMSASYATMSSMLQNKAY